ncbi:MAG: hypothetical protein AAF492_01760 [Verrucomicrobiota bacterium]
MEARKRYLSGLFIVLLLGIVGGVAFFSGSGLFLKAQSLSDPSFSEHAIAHSLNVPMVITYWGLMLFGIYLMKSSGVNLFQRR